MDKNKQSILALVGSLLIIVALFATKKDKQQQTEKVTKIQQPRPKSSFVDVIRVSAPIITPFAKVVADQLNKKINA